MVPTSKCRPTCPITKRASSGAREVKYRQVSCAFGIFWGLPDPEDRPPDDVVDAGLPAFFDWFTLDLPLDEGGPTLVELLLERHRAILSPAERDFLVRMSRTEARMYEITEVRRDEGFRLADVWTGASVWVHERSATHQLVRWDLVAARLAPGRDGVMMFEGTARPFPAGMKDQLRRVIADHVKAFRRRHPGGNESEVFKRSGPVLWNYGLLDSLDEAGPPVVQTTQGEPLVITRVRFEVSDPEAAAAALDRHPELESGPGNEWVWVEDAGGPKRLLGRIELTGKRLMLEAMSEMRGGRGRRLIEEALGAGVRHLATTCEDAMEAVMRRPSSRPPRLKRDTIPPEVEAEVVGQLLDRHYREWLDLPVPALARAGPGAPGLTGVRIAITFRTYATPRVSCLPPSLPAAPGTPAVRAKSGKSSGSIPSRCGGPRPC